MLSYTADYAAVHLFARDLRALSIRCPVDIDLFEIRAREANANIDPQLLACALGDFGDVVHTLPSVLRDCDVDEVIIEQRQADIERLATTLADLPRSERTLHATSAP